MKISLTIGEVNLLKRIVDALHADCYEAAAGNNKATRAEWKRRHHLASIVSKLDAAIEKLEARRTGR